MYISCQHNLAAVRLWLMTRLKLTAVAGKITSVT